MKTYNYNGRQVYLKFTTYANNGCLAVQMLCEDDPEFYEIITVNVNVFLQGEKLAFLDENNLPGIGKWLGQHRIAKKTGIYQNSGFCSYPLYEFNI